MPVTIDQIRKVVSRAQDVVESLNRHFQPPELVKVDGKPFFRHSNKNDLLLSQLKCIRAISSLHACILLLENGYVQEVGTLCRCIDDFNQEVLFLATPLGDNGPSEQQRRLVNEFFQEEFDNTSDPFGSAQQRNRVPRSKVLAGISRIFGQPINPNDIQELHRTLQQGFSGYVHGAYVHIMEIFGGQHGNLHYHMQGLNGTPRIPEWTEALSNYVYRTMCAVEVVSKRCQDSAAVQAIQTARHVMEEAMGMTADAAEKPPDRFKSE